MSSKKDLRRSRRNVQLPASPRAETASAPPRSAFSITLTFDPARPQAANVNVMQIGGDANGGAHIEDVVTALRMGYEQAVMQKGAWLLQQQMAAQQAASEGNGGQGEGTARAAR